MDPCCCCHYAKRFCNPQCFSMNTTSAHIFPVSARTEDEIWKTIESGIWLVKCRDICELNCTFCTGEPVYLAFFFGQFFQGIAQMRSVVNKCSECYLTWWYVKDIPMIDFFCITSCFTYKHMLKIGMNLVRKFLIKFHCFDCPFTCAPCGNCSCNCKSVECEAPCCQRGPTDHRMSEFHLFLLKTSSNEVARMLACGCLSYKPCGSSCDPINYVNCFPVYVCLEDQCEDKYCGLIQVTSTCRLNEQQGQLVTLNFVVVCALVKPTLEDVKTTAVTGDMYKVVFQCDAEKLLRLFDCGHDCVPPINCPPLACSSVSKVPQHVKLKPSQSTNNPKDPHPTNTSNNNYYSCCCNSPNYCNGVVDTCVNPKLFIAFASPSVIHNIGQSGTWCPPFRTFDVGAFARQSPVYVGFADSTYQRIRGLALVVPNCESRCPMVELQWICNGELPLDDVMRLGDASTFEYEYTEENYVTMMLQRHGGTAQQMINLIQTCCAQRGGGCCCQRACNCQGISQQHALGNHPDVEREIYNAEQLELRRLRARSEYHRQVSEELRAARLREEAELYQWLEQRRKEEEELARRRQEEEELARRRKREEDAARRRQMKELARLREEEVKRERERKEAELREQEEKDRQAEKDRADEADARALLEEARRMLEIKDAELLELQRLRDKQDEREKILREDLDAQRKINNGLLGGNVKLDEEYEIRTHEYENGLEDQLAGGDQGRRRSSVKKWRGSGGAAAKGQRKYSEVDGFKGRHTEEQYHQLKKELEKRKRCEEKKRQRWIEEEEARQRERRGKKKEEDWPMSRADKQEYVRKLEEDRRKRKTQEWNVNCANRNVTGAKERRSEKRPKQVRLV